MADRTVLLVPRRRQALTLLGLLTAAVLVVVVGAAVANGFPGGAQSSPYRTALVASGTVRQALSLSGTAARVGQVTVGWPMSGTVATVDVSVGQQVSQGQQLATMDTVPLQQAVLDAGAQADQARVSLDNDESAATSQSGGQSSSSATGSAATGSTSGRGGVAASTGSRTGSSGSSGGGAPIDTNGLTAAGAKVDQAQQAAVSACAPLLVTPSGTGKPVASTSTHPSETSPSSTTARASTPTSESRSTSPTTSSSTPTSPTSPTSTDPTGPTGPTAEQVTACLAALQAVSSAQAQAGSTIDSLAAQLAKAAAALAANSSGSSAGSGSSTGTSGSGSTGQAAGAAGAPSSGSAGGESAGSAVASSEAKVILDQAALTNAEAALTKANDELAAATLTAPVSGVVGSVSLAAGSATAANTGIVIVTPSAATVTVQVPQANLASLAVGQAATVTPAGGGSLSGSVSSISLLPTSSSTGSSATTYAVVVDVPQATDALATGAKASVTIETSRVDNVLTVPVSAVTSVATGTGSVGVLRDGSVSQTTVRTGSVGQGKVQILSGLAAGQSVVLADTSQALPSNNTGFGARVGGAAGAGGLTGGGGGGLAGPGGAPPGAGPGR